MTKTKTVDMTNGPFAGNMIKFALPLIFTGLLQLLYNTADSVVVGKFAGNEALAAVGSTGSLVNLIVNLFVGLSMGSGVIAARFLGAGDKKRIHRCVHTAMSISLVCGVIMMVVGFFFAKTFLRLMNSPENVIDLSTLYLKIYFLGAPGSLVYNFGASILRASGDTKKPLYILLFSGIVNVILNLILVIPFKMSVSGVAIATIVSQYISAVMIVIFLMKDKGDIRLSLKALRFYKVELKSILRLGIPAGLQNALFSVSNVIIQSAVNNFGDIAMAGIAAGSNFDSYVYTCTNAIGQTSMTFSSQNIGAGKPQNVKRVYRNAFLMTLIIGSVLSWLGFFFREPLVGIFSSDPEVIEIGAQRLALIMPFYVLCSLQDTAGCQIRGMGKSIEPMTISLIGVCGIRIFWVFAILPMMYSLINLYWAYPISWFVTLVAQSVLIVITQKQLDKKYSLAT
ncbi:MAG: MATE family efflux transporter [Clostridia bacterium]|nr:MATE family efflux transporter [Clostridia bacterium]